MSRSFLNVECASYAHTATSERSNGEKTTETQTASTVQKPACDSFVTSACCTPHDTRSMMGWKPELTYVRNTRNTPSVFTRNKTQTSSTTSSSYSCTYSFSSDASISHSYLRTQTTHVITWQRKATSSKRPVFSPHSLPLSSTLTKKN